jgi:hypothetical protein
VLRPLATFIYNYFVRLGFLDGREGLLLHMYHAGYVSWKYAKAWEMGRTLVDAEPDPTATGESQSPLAGEQPEAGNRAPRVDLPR